MLLKEQGKSLFSPHPQSFSALMELYEMNYIQLRMLVGDLRTLPPQVVSPVDGHVPVLLQVQEQTAHTSTLLLTYLFSELTAKEKQARPDLRIRVYHDAQQVEVIQHQCHIAKSLTHHWRGKIDGQLLEKWRINRFLYKWILHLRKRQYRFQPML